MNIAIVETYEDFRRLKKDWNELLERSSFRHPQLMWEWFDAAWSYMESPKHVAVFCARDGERLVGIGPMAVLEGSLLPKGYFKVRVLSWILYSSDVVDFIVEKEVAKQVVEEIWKAVHDYGKWDFLKLDNFTSMSPNFLFHHQVCNRLFRSARWRLLDGHPHLRVSGSFQGYYEDVRRSKAIADIERRLRRLEEKGGRVRFETRTTWDEKIHEELLRLAGKRKEAGDRSPLLADSLRTQWLSRVRESYNGLGYWLICLLYDDAGRGSLIAYAICFSSGEGLYYWTVSFDPDYAEHSVGKLLLRHVIEEAWLRGARLFDFMAGAEEYKLQWRPEVAFFFGLCVSRTPITEAWRWTRFLRPGLRRIIPGW